MRRRGPALEQALASAIITPAGNRAGAFPYGVCGIWPRQSRDTFVFCADDARRAAGGHGPRSHRLRLSRVGRWRSRWFGIFQCWRSRRHRIYGKPGRQWLLHGRGRRRCRRWRWWRCKRCWGCRRHRGPPQTNLNGADGASPGPGGGGGGGGGFNGNGSGAATINNATPLLGGNGGAGGNGGVPAAFDGGGGGGGAGGYGAIVTGATSNSNASSISGGLGGNGGNGVGDNGGTTRFTSGGGGDGGVGVFFTVPGASLTNTGAIAGGNGGVPVPSLMARDLALSASAARALSAAA